MDSDIVGRTYPAVGPYLVSAEKVAEFALALGWPAEAPAAAIPPTFPTILSAQALEGFLAAEGLELRRIVHGEQRFAYARPLRVGDVLIATLAVTGFRSVGDAAFVTTTTEFRAGDELVCTGRSMVIHR